MIARKVKFSRLALQALPAIGLIFAAGVHAQSGVATADAETSIFQDQPNDNAGSYFLFCIGNFETDETRRGLARFTLPAIPADAVITRVDYELVQDRVRNMDGGPRTANIEMRRIMQDWQEGSGVQGGGPCGGGSEVPGVRWNTAPNVSATISATEFLPSTNNTPITIDTDIGDDDDGLIDDVQAWVDDPASNFGWEYRVTEENITHNARRMQPGSMTIHWTIQQGGVTIVKNGALDLGGNGIADPGDMINYTFMVTNSGDVTLSDVSVTDPLVSPITCPSGNPIPSMAPGAMETCTGSYAITQIDIDNGVVNNTADADGQCGAGNCPVNDDDTHMETIPQNGGVMIVKNGELDLGGNGIPDPGDIINYTFEITNSGNVTLSGVAVTDPLVAPILCPSGNPIPAMAPGAMETCTGSYAITQADIDAGAVNNIADADAQCAAANCPVNDDDTHMENIPAGPLDFESGFENPPKQ
jgi:uncharacterized repeat protein (TIGR01451 family)